jgi:hypothetical protein
MAVSKKIKDDISKKRKQKEKNIENYKQELLVVDAEKEPYDIATRQLDLDILASIEVVNQSMYDTQAAYQARMDSGCYSDLFWRAVNYTIGDLTVDIVVDQSTRSGYGEPVFYIEPVTGNIISYEENAKVGLTTQNLYGLKYFDQPYLKDIGDTTLGTFVGQIGLGSTVLTIITQDPDELIVGFDTGNVITCSKQGVFPSTTNTIVGFGTTTISGISTSLNELIGISTDPFYTISLILKDATIGFSSLPEADGSYVDYTVVISPDDFEAEKPRFKYELKVSKNSNKRKKFTKNPFSPETIGILDTTTAGTGYKVKLDNSGSPSATQEWKPELKGSEIGGETIKEPNVGGGKIFFPTGFAYRPVVSPGVPASKGTSLSGIDIALLANYYESTPSCTAAVNNAVNTAASNQAAKESSISGPCVANIEDAANAMRNERSEYALRIWGMRQSIGNQNNELDELEALDIYLEQSSPIIDGKSSSNCVE